MKIPRKITIEIFDKKNQPVKKEILMGIKIYHNDESYHNLPPFKTEKSGKILINQEDILKNLINHENINAFQPEKIEVEIWNCELTNSILNSLDLLSSNNIKDIKEDLIKRGFDEKSANEYSTISFQKIQEDIRFLNSFKNVENCNTKFQKTKIVDNWKNHDEKNYKFIVE